MFCRLLRAGRVRRNPLIFQGLLPLRDTTAAIIPDAEAIARSIQTRFLLSSPVFGDLALEEADFEELFPDDFFFLVFEELSSDASLPLSWSRSGEVIVSFFSSVFSSVFFPIAGISLVSL